MKISPIVQQSSVNPQSLTFAFISNNLSFVLSRLKRVHRPHVTGQRGQHFKTLVAADGGGPRGLISVLLLVELEDSIKRYILIEKPNWLPKGTGISSIEDFEVSLADFIDCFAGTSAGGWTALYLASKGGNGASTDALNEKRIIKKYGLIDPISAKALVVFYNEFVSQMFPPYWNKSPPQNEGEVDPASPGIMTPLLNNTVFVQTFNTWFGNTTLSELHTSCMTIAFHLIRRTRLLFVHDQLGPESKTGFTEVIRRRKPRSKNENFFADIKGHHGLDFYLRDLAYAGSSGLGVTPSREFYSLSGAHERLLPVDGNLHLTSPTFPALVQIANSTGDTTFSRIAVLSLGTGMSLPSWAEEGREGSIRYDDSYDRISDLVYLLTEPIVQQLKLLLNANLDTKPGQYLRIQPAGRAGSKFSEIISQSIYADNWADISAIGEELGEKFRSSLDSFVNDFVFT